VPGIGNSLAVATIGLRQECPSWGGIWRKSPVKPQPEEHVTT